MIWLGDFNRHHPQWDEERNAHLFTAANLTAAEQLLEQVAQADMEMVLEPGVPTLEALRTGNHTRPDNVFCSRLLAENLVYCAVRPDLRPPNTDHYPILTTLQLRLPRRTRKTWRNYHQVEWADFRQTLRARMPETPEHLNTIAEMEEHLNKVYQAIEQTAEAHVPDAKVVPHTKRWWSKELTQQRKVVGKLGLQAYRNRCDPVHPVHEQFRRARNDYRMEIKTRKKAHWNSWLEDLDTNTIWDVTRYMDYTPSDAGCSATPPLRENPQSQTYVNTDDSKAKLLFKSFFPLQEIHTVPGPLIGQQTREPEPEPVLFTESQVYRAINKLSPHKAPGPNGIPNIVYKECADSLIPHLVALFTASFSLGHFPSHWSQSTTVVLRKPLRPDYTLPKAYRPIALLDTMGKILSSCVAEDLRQVSETKHLLPGTHFGGRPGRSTGDALHLIAQYVKDAWRKKQVASALFLDVKAAFLSVDVECLLSKMQELKVPRQYILWLRSRL